jgi:ABC-2 type transport system permease protein
MLRIFRAFVRKEMFHIVRDPRTLFILFGMPIALVLIFGYTISNEFRGASIGIYNQAHDQLSIELIDHIKASGHFEVVALSNTNEQLEDLFKAGDIKLGLVIPPQFEEEFYKDNQSSLQIITDATEPNYAATLTNYASKMIMDFQLLHNEVQQAPYSIDIETRMLYNPKLIGAYNFVPGVVALILMLISAMLTSLTIAKEKETGTMDLLLVSPLPPILILLGKVAPYSILSFINAVIVLAMGYFIFEVPILGSVPLLLALCLLYLLVALALGILISTKAKTQQVAMVVSMFALLLPTMLLSGFIFPISSMPTILQYISKIIPAKYFIIIEKVIMLKGAGFEAIVEPSLVLILMFVVLILVARKNFKVVYQ